MEKNNREKIIVKTSVLGIIVNVILVAFKAFVGIVANSIAIILDAINNLSDAFSQVVTIVGTKLALKAPDKKHPYGYGRIEYITSAIVASIVLVAGITSFKESLLKVFNPEKSEYSFVSLLIIAVAVVVKFVFGTYVKSVGKKVDSQSLVATGTDSFMDSILSASTLLAAILSKFAGLNLEGILGVVLSVFIMKAGLEILKETFGSIIGGRIDQELSIELKKKVRSYEGVKGAYDLILHDYGPSRSIGSVHIEVDSGMTAEQIHILSRRIISDVMDEYKILLTVGVYAANSSDEKILAMRKNIGEIVKSNSEVIQMHGFFVDEERKFILFDTVISYKVPSVPELVEKMKTDVKAKYPEYRVDINIDRDFSD